MKTFKFNALIVAVLIVSFFSPLTSSAMTCAKQIQKLQAEQYLRIRDQVSYGLTDDESMSIRSEYLVSVMFEKRYGNLARLSQNLCKGSVPNCNKAIMEIHKEQYARILSEVAGENNEGDEESVKTAKHLHKVQYGPALGLAYRLCAKMK